MTTRSSRTRTFGALMAWLAAAVAATVVGFVAVGAIGSGILPRTQRPLSPPEVNDRLAQATSAPTPASTDPTTSSATPAPTTSPSPLPPAAPESGPTEVFDSRGGTVIARCTPGVDVLSATPAQGYQLKDVEPDDGGQRVRFETGDSGPTNRVEVRINCVAGRPVASTR